VDRLSRPWRVLPLLGMMGLLFYASSQPGDSFELPELFEIDKVLHCLAYAVLAACVLFAFPDRSSWPGGFSSGLGVVLFCLAYGISDEFHQLFVPYRSACVSDLVADTVGAVFAVLLWRWWRARRRSRRSAAAG